MISRTVAWLDAKPHRIWLFLGVLALAIAGCCAWMAAETARVEHPDTAFHLP